MLNFRSCHLPYKYGPYGDGRREVPPEGRTLYLSLSTGTQPAVSTGRPQLMRLDVVSAGFDVTLSCSPLLLTIALTYTQISLFLLSVPIRFL